MGLQFFSFEFDYSNGNGNGNGQSKSFRALRDFLLSGKRKHCEAKRSERQSRPEGRARSAK